MSMRVKAAWMPKKRRTTNSSSSKSKILTPIQTEFATQKFLAGNGPSAVKKLIIEQYPELEGNDRLYSALNNLKKRLQVSVPPIFQIRKKPPKPGSAAENFGSDRKN